MAELSASVFRSRSLVPLSDAAGFFPPLKRNLGCIDKFPWNGLTLSERWGLTELVQRFPMISLPS